MFLNKILFCLLFIGVSASLYGQRDTIKISDIEVVKEYRPFVEDGVKQNFVPVLPNISKDKEAHNLYYNIPQQFIETNFSPDEIKPLPITNENVDYSKLAYLKAGFGNAKNPLLQLAANKNTLNNYSVGLIAEHQGVNKELDSIINQKMSESKFALFGTKEMFEKSLHGNISYQRGAYEYYGFNSYSDNVSYNIQTQKLSQLGGSFGVESLPNDSWQIGYTGDIGFSSSKANLYDQKEGGFEINGSVFQDVTDLISAQIDANFETRKTTSPLHENSEWRKYSSNVIRATPYVKLFHNGVYGELGASLNHDKDNGFQAFPKLLVELPLNNQSLLLYGGWNGRTDMNSLTSMYEENPYLSPNSIALNYTEEILTPVGLRYNVNQNFSLHANVSKEKHKNVPLFVVANSQLSPSEKNPTVFDQRYEEKLINWKPEVEVNFQKGKLLSALGSFSYNSYTTETESQPWNLPKLEAGLTLTSEPISNLKINLDGNVYNGIEVLNLYHNTAETLPSIFNLNLGARYSITDDIEIFLDANNLTNSKNMFWKNYESIGVNFIGGIVLSY